MSNRYSLSPKLRLRIAESSQRRLGFFALLLFYLTTTVLCISRGYPGLALFCAVTGACVLHGLARSRWVGAQLTWSHGVWSVESQGLRHNVEVLPHSLALPWVIYLVLRVQPQGRRECLWLFSDSAATRELRKLRVRLRLAQT